jgi:hypothetical protein
MLLNCYKWRGTRGGVTYGQLVNADSNLSGLLSMQILSPGIDLPELSSKFPGLKSLKLHTSEVIKVKALEITPILVLAPVEFGLGRVNATVLYHEGQEDVFYCFQRQVRKTIVDMDYAEYATGILAPEYILFLAR